MAKRKSNDPVFEEKRIPKADVKFKISLNEEQKDAKAIIYNSDVTVLMGRAGSGKTLLCCEAALSMLTKRQVKRIVVMRPTVADKTTNLGFLPGSLAEKMEEWVKPVMHNFEMLMGKPAIEKYVEEGTIEFGSFQHLQGITFTDTFVIVDEYENLSKSLSNILFGRIGLGSKMVLSGDKNQIQLDKKTDSCCVYMPILEKKIESFNIVELKANHRSPIVERILEVIEEEQDRK